METLEKKLAAEREPNKESKEKEIDPELAKAATMERADILVKEIKTSTSQMQNIAINIANVKNAIASIRKQLQINDDHNDPESVKQDAKAAENLHKKIVEYQKELVAMKDDLIQEQIAQLTKAMPHMSADDIFALANRQVNTMLEIDAQDSE